MPHIGDNNDNNPRTKIDIKKRKMTLYSARYISSRYVLSQQRGPGIGAIGIGLTNIGSPANIKKQVSDTPAIITPKGYTNSKRKSQRISDRFTMKNNKSKSKNNKNNNNNTIHHKQQSTQIDGWEDISDNNPNQPVVGFVKGNDNNKNHIDV
eukprot:86166_1